MTVGAEPKPTSATHSMLMHVSVCVRLIHISLCSCHRLTICDSWYGTQANIISYIQYVNACECVHTYVCAIHISLSGCHRVTISYSWCGAQTNVSCTQYVNVYIFVCMRAYVSVCVRACRSHLLLWLSQSHNLRQLVNLIQRQLHTVR